MSLPQVPVIELRLLAFAVAITWPSALTTSITCWLGSTVDPLYTTASAAAGAELAPAGRPPPVTRARVAVAEEIVHGLGEEWRPDDAVRDAEEADLLGPPGAPQAT